MKPRQPLPRQPRPLPRMWLMTDERQGDRLWAALAKLPRGAGVVFRHYGLPDPVRRDMLDKVRRIARRHRLTLLVAGRSLSARIDGHHGRHSRRLPRHRLRSAPVHDVSELRQAERTGADLLFISPVFATRSHPGARPLGRVRFGLLAGQTRLPVIALGGMDSRRARSLARFGIYGWGAMDAWS